MAIEQVKRSREEDLFGELIKLGESYGVNSIISSPIVGEDAKNVKTVSVTK